MRIERRAQVSRAMQFGALSEQLHSVTAVSEGLRDQTHQIRPILTQ